MTDLWTQFVEAWNNTPPDQRPLVVRFLAAINTLNPNRRNTP